MAVWHPLKDARTVAQQAASLIGEAAQQAIDDHGQFSLVLAGGTTPVETYRILSNQSHQWDRWQLFYGDERCLPVSHPERNSEIVIHSGLTQKIIQHFPIPAELGPHTGAEKYAITIAHVMPFDLVLLGMGEDGHTASLFPGSPLTPALTVAVSNSPKPPPERVSLGISALQNCHQMLVLVTGNNKCHAVRQWQQQQDLPVAAVSNLPQCQILLEQSLLDNDCQHDQ